MPRQGRRASGRAFAVAIVVVLAVALAIWLLEGRPGLPGGEGSSGQAGLTSPQGGQYVAIDVGPLGESGGPRIGEPAPDFVLPDIEGRPVQLSSLRGRVVLVNFWATWCVPCRKEIPGLVRTYREHRSEGFEIVAVSLQEPPDQVRRFVSEWGMDYVVVVDRTGSVERQYRLTGIPISFFIDREGVLRDLRIGAVKEEFVKCVVATLLSAPDSYRPGNCS